MRRIITCEICGRSKNEYPVGFHSKSGKILCGKHKAQYDRYGRFMEQTRYEPNKIINDGKISYICLNDFRGNIVDKAIIDTEDLPKVSGYKWFKRVDGRVVANVASERGESSHVRLHNVIMNPTEGYMVDHVKGDTLDNRKEMLRIVTEKQNACNNTIQTNNTSGVVGVTRANYDGWIPQIKKDRRMIRLGSHKSFDVAVERRLRGECLYFGKYSRNYNPSTNTIQLTYLSHDDNLETFIEVDLEGNVLQFKKLGDPNEL